MSQIDTKILYYVVYQLFPLRDRLSDAGIHKMQRFEHSNINALCRHSDVTDGCGQVSIYTTKLNKYKSKTSENILRHYITKKNIFRAQDCLEQMRT